MANKKPLKRESGKTKEFAAGDTLANEFMPTKVTKGGDTDGANLTVGTNDLFNVNVISNSSIGFSVTTDLRTGIRKSDPQAALQIYGDGTNGSNAFIFFGDSVANSNVPYVSIGENGGTDSDAMAIFGKQGIFIRVDTNTSTSALYISAAGRMGLVNESPTAKLHLQPCTSGANNSSLKIPSGTLSTASDGAVDYDGTNFYACVSTTRYQLARVLTGSGVLDFGNTAAQTSAELTIAVTGAATGDSVVVSPPTASNVANSCYTARVSSAGVVAVKLNNYSAAAIDPPSGTFKVTVFKNI